MNYNNYLKDIAEVIAGYSFRTALRGEKAEGLLVVQVKNILSDASVDEANLDRIDFENYRSKAAVQKSDVLISSRGNFRAGVVRSGERGMIAASSVYILRLKTERVVPDYLAIFLNSVDGQKQLVEIATGAGIQSIRKADLEKVNINFPGLEIQKKIIRIFQTNKKIQLALARKIQLINSINEGVINKLLNN